MHIDKTNFVAPPSPPPPQLSFIKTAETTSNYLPRSTQTVAHIRGDLEGGGGGPDGWQRPINSNNPS